MLPSKRTLPRGGSGRAGAPHSGALVPERESSLMKTRLLDIAQEFAARHYGDGPLERAEGVAHDLLGLFQGRHPRYQACDTKYHDLAHTIQVIDPYVGIIDGWNDAGKSPRITRRYFELGLIAVLLHDTGYIKQAGDTVGTGGKFTFVHILRSIEFASSHLAARGFAPEEIDTICTMISCTGVMDHVLEIGFHSEEERVCGFALGTADLLGQMAAADYPEKLEDLYNEFTEGYTHEGLESLRQHGASIFGSAQELVRSTPIFYDRVVKIRFEEMGSLDSLLWRTRPDRAEWYRRAIETNLERVRNNALSGA